MWVMLRNPLPRVVQFQGRPAQSRDRKGADPSLSHQLGSAPLRLQLCAGYWLRAEAPRGLSFAPSPYTPIQ